MAGHYITYENGKIHFDQSGERIANVAKVETLNQTNVETKLSNGFDSSLIYVIDGTVDLTGLDVDLSITSGVEIIGVSSNKSVLKCSDDNFTLLSGTTTGDITLQGLTITIDGSNSSVFGVDSDNGLQSIEVKDVNFDYCSSLGYADGFRQWFEDVSRRFFGTPELEFRGTWDGVVVRNSLVRFVEDFTSLFKVGSGFTFSGRFITNINVDLPTSGAFIDFAPSNVVNSESLILNGVRVTRDGVIDSKDTDIYPNIDHTSVKSLWKSNVGIPNTNKYIKGVIDSEVETVIIVTNTYYPLLGTYGIELSSHFDEPSNGEFRLLSGNGTYSITGDFQVEGGNGDVLELRVTKSSDGGSSFPTQINHIRRVVNNFAGSSDYAFFPVDFLADLSKDERLRVEIRNTTDTSNVTAVSGSFIAIREA